jgi:hypothetical protein
MSLTYVLYLLLRVKTVYTSGSCSQNLILRQKLCTSFPLSFILCS